VELYSGPDIMMNFKYSNVMNIILCAFTHGVALPILWPITLFGIINNYAFERIALAYYYKQPPLFDNRLNAKALNILQSCPVIMMCLGYWYLGNRQMFFNKFSPIEDAFGEIADPQHYLFDYSEGADHTLILLIFIPIFIFHRKVIQGVSWLFGKCGLLNLGTLNMIQNETINIDENLGHFSQCLSGIDQKRWFADAMYLRNNLHIKTLDDEQIKLVQREKRQDRLIMNTPNYNLLANVNYAEKFQYVQVDQRFENASSDFVAQIVNLAEERVAASGCKERAGCDNLDVLASIKKYTSSVQVDREDMTKGI